MLPNVCFQCAFQLLLKLLVLAAVTVFGLRTIYAERPQRKHKAAY